MFAVIRYFCLPSCPVTVTTPSKTDTIDTSWMPLKIPELSLLLQTNNFIMTLAVKEWWARQNTQIYHSQYLNCRFPSCSSVSISKVNKISPFETNRNGEESWEKTRHESLFSGNWNIDFTCFTIWEMICIVIAFLNLTMSTNMGIKKNIACRNTGSNKYLIN